MAAPELERGWVAFDLAQEFPSLALWLMRVQARSGRSPEPVRRRLRRLSDRITGGHVIHMRQDAVPWAYRVFWRQVGIDPDTDRTPVEQIALDRLKWGGIRSRNLLDDALVIATFETGVPVIAVDADKVGKALGLRLTGDDERLGGTGRSLSSRQIVVADEDCCLAVLSGEVSEDHGVRSATRSMVLCALQVKGVPEISVEEALWTASDTLSVGG
ncbi:MAG: phenylalanine--tRNA ligase beta subunit-related protein [Thermoleophilaceae bacterium]